MSGGRLLFAILASIALSLPAQAQDGDDDGRGGALGTAEDIDPGESPVIIEERRPDTGPSGEPLRSERESLVQIEGAWASNPGACAGVENGGGLYLTDTLVRWEGATCSIREIDTREESARLHAHCTGLDGRSDRVFEVEVRGQDELAWHGWVGDDEEVLLRRCPE